MGLSSCIPPCGGPGSTRVPRRPVRAHLRVPPRACALLLQLRVAHAPIAAATRCTLEGLRARSIHAAAAREETIMRLTLIGEGVVVGVAGAAAVAIWFLLCDLAAGMPFRTPALLGA